MMHEQLETRRDRLTKSLVLLLIFACCIPPGVLAQGADDSKLPDGLSQIAVLAAEKAARTPAQQKIDSNLLYHAARLRGASSLTAAVADFRLHGEVRENGAILVELRAEVAEPLLRRIVEEGGEVVSQHPRWDAIRAWIPALALERIAEDPAVRWIRTALPMMRQMLNTTEGDVAHAGDVARTTFSVDGTGVQVGVMSDSVDALADLQASGDLPAEVTVLDGQSGNPGSSEGTALLEIVHDMAPGADLFFATAIGGEAQMAQNILDLQAAGCDVIVDDVLYFAEPVFQDGIIAQVVDAVVDAGTVYFTSSGNSGNLANGTSGVFEGDYAAGAMPAPLNGLGESAHEFSGGDVFNTIDLDGPFLFTLQWSDPFGGSGNDYDLYMLSSDFSTVLGASTSTQSGAGFPFEFLDTFTDDDLGNHLVVVKVGGDDRFIHLNTHRGELEYGTNGQIYGHPGAELAFTVGAVDVATAAGGVFTGGPANPSEFFNSDGPRRIYFNPDGSPVATAAPLQGPPPQQSFITRQKPDIAAADGVSTATPGFNPFFGSSASAPHAAAISALMLENFPGLTHDQIDNLFKSTALDIDSPGIDELSGSGIIMAPDITDGTPIFADGFESGDTSAWTK